MSLAVFTFYQIPSQRWFPNALLFCSLYTYNYTSWIICRVTGKTAHHPCSIFKHGCFQSELILMDNTLLHFLEHQLSSLRVRDLTLEKKTFLLILFVYVLLVCVFSHSEKERWDDLQLHQRHDTHGMTQTQPQQNCGQKKLKVSDFFWISWVNDLWLIITHS